MAQSKALLRFRARLRSRGYTEIKITRCSVDDFETDEFGNVLYRVKCVEPLLGFNVIFYASEPQLDNWPGIEFDIGEFFKPEIIDYFDYGGD